MSLVPGQVMSIADIDELAVAAKLPGARVLNVLMIADDIHPANVVRDHIAAIVRHSGHRVWVLNPRTQHMVAPIMLRGFDALIVHYSCSVLIEHLLPQAYRDFIAGFRGLKMLSIQDECRQVDKVIGQMETLGINVILSSLVPDNIRKVYADPRLGKVIKVASLPGYVAEELVVMPSPPVSRRPLHAVYRARELPFWLGAHARQKGRIATLFAAAADRHGLRVDVDDREARRVYGDDWIAFLQSAKAMLGTEGGASIFDFDGSCEARSRRYLAEFPDASFEQVYEEILREYEGNVVHATITPRIFEAIALRTPLVLFEGSYSGVLEPWHHYLPLASDFSNADEIVGLLLDADLLQAMADRAYREIALADAWSARRFGARIGKLLDLSLEAFAATNKGVIRSSLDARPSRLSVPIDALRWRIADAGVRGFRAASAARVARRRLHAYWQDQAYWRSVRELARDNPGSALGKGLKRLWRIAIYPVQAFIGSAAPKSETHRVRHAAQARTSHGRQQ